MSESSPHQNGRLYLFLAFLVMAAFAVVWIDHQGEPAKAAKAVLKAARPTSAGPNDLQLIRVGLSSYRRTLWCARVPDRTPGEVAVLTWRGRGSPFSGVADVATAWKPDPTRQEADMLAQCARVRHGPAATLTRAG